MKIGLSLAGGGVKGSYQIGAYYAFKKCHIKFNGIVGTSIGSANGAVLASGNYKKLLYFWQNVKPAELLEIDPDLIKLYQLGNINANLLLGTLKESAKVIKNHGFTTVNIQDEMKKLINIEKIKKGNIDFGLATYNFTKHKPIYIFKEDIESDKFIDYIMASCSLPIFKLEKNIDNNLYLDGGFYDNCPTNMLIKKDYDVIYEVQIKGIGFNQKNLISKAKVITISPSRNNGSIFEMNHDRILDNIYMGYYDTLKKLNKLWGYKYTFKKDYFLNYEYLFKNIDKFTKNRVATFFNTKNEQEMIIKALEYIMEKENYDYNKVYKIKAVIKNISNKDNFVYAFIKGLSI